MPCHLMYKGRFEKPPYKYNKCIPTFIVPASPRQPNLSKKNSGDIPPSVDSIYIAAMPWSEWHCRPPAISQSRQHVDNAEATAARAERNGCGGNAMRRNTVWFISFHLIGRNISWGQPHSAPCCYTHSHTHTLILCHRKPIDSMVVCCLVRCCFLASCHIASCASNPDGLLQVAKKIFSDNSGIGGLAVLKATCLGTRRRRSRNSLSNMRFFSTH